MAELWYLSEKAYGLLVTKAMEGGFVNENSKSKVGISKFINILSRGTFTDTRPGGLSEDDEYLISMRRTPTWSTGLYTRTARTLDISENTKIRLGILALDFRIFMGRYYRGGPYYKSPVSIGGAVLEAIGLKYLTPRDWPRTVVNSLLSVKYG